MRQNRLDRRARSIANAVPSRDTTIKLELEWMQLYYSINIIENETRYCLEQA